MRNLIIFLFVVLLSPQLGTFAQSNSDGSLELIRQHPQGWFALRLPSDIRRLEGPIDVDGGRYESDVLEIHFDYWTYQNTPNWLRGKYATSLLLACSGQSNHTRTQRTWIDGNRAIVQQCSVTDERRGFRYIYYVTFPKLKIFDGEKFRNGMFNFTVEYKLRRYSAIAKRIILSLDFDANAPPNNALQLTAR
jgi:hypothetical protein